MDTTTYERLAEIVHTAYVRACRERGWPVRSSLGLPYHLLSESDKFLARCIVRALFPYIFEESGIVDALLARLGETQRDLDTIRALLSSAPGTPPRSTS